MKYLSFFILLAISINLYAQEAVYKQFSVENGLLSSNATQVLQDDEGYIWISTNNGVVRFDGYRFQNFDVNNGLIENDIIQMLKDEYNVIWFLSKSGQLCYFKDDQILEYPYNHEITKVIKDYDLIESKSLCILHNRVEFNLYDNARFSIDASGKISKVYALEDGLNTIDFSEGRERYFISSQNTNLWLKMDAFSKKIHMPEICLDEPVLIKKFKDEVFMVSKNFLHHITKDTTKSYIYKQNITALEIDSKKTLWIGFETAGVFSYENANVEQDHKIQRIDEATISSVLRDRQNSMWMTSLNKGLFFIPSENFRHITTRDGLLDNNMTKMSFSNTHLWAVTGKNTIARINEEATTNFEFKNPDFAKVTDIYWFQEKLWVSFKNKISRFDGDELVDVFKLDNKNGRYSRINGMVSGINKDLWICKSDGFSQLKDGKLVFESTVNNYQNLNVNGIVAEPNGNLWLACKNGLWKFEGNQLFNYSKNSDLLSHNIIDIDEDEKTGALWLAINGLGVVKIQNDSVRLISEKDGLISNSVTSIDVYEDYLWVGTRAGVSQIDIHNNDFKKGIRNVTINDGLISNEVNEIEVNKYYVAISTNKGLGFFDHELYKPEYSIRDVKIEKIRVDGKAIAKHNPTVEVDYNSNNISIDFKAIHFKSRGRINYRYRIKGLDKDWTYTQNRNATYSFLPSGQYAFEVCAVNKNNTWASESTYVKFCVSKPYWKEWWFFLMIVTVLSFLGFVIYNFISENRKQKAKVQREINEYRQMALTKQMNPHFIFNSLNSIQHYILQNDKRLSNRFLTKFSSLIRLILENSQSSLITLDKELGSLNLYLELESLRFKEKLQYKIEISSEIDILGTSLPPMLIQPFVENAIWHGIMNKEDEEQGQLLIKFESEKERVICLISDNGVGRQKANAINGRLNKTHTSLGTEITKDRIELINNIFNKEYSIEYKDHEDENGHPKGTTVKIIFPK